MGVHDVDYGLGVVEGEDTTAGFGVVVMGVGEITLTTLLLLLMTDICLVILGYDTVLLLNLPQYVLLFRNCLHTRIPRYIVAVVFMLAFNHFTIFNVLSIVLNGQRMFGLQRVQQFIGVVNYMDFDWGFIEDLM